MLVLTKYCIMTAVGEWGQCMVLGKGRVKKLNSNFL